LTSFPILDYEDAPNSEIHEEKFQVFSLRSLTVFGQPHWDSLSAWLQNLSSLAELHLYDFGFKAVPEWIKDMSSLERLGLYWCEKCEEAIKDDRKSMLNGVGIATGSAMQEVLGDGRWRSSLGCVANRHRNRHLDIDLKVNPL
ncbi:hypothetical protein EJD97_014740, partial [Solanum chilense]